MRLQHRTPNTEFMKTYLSSIERNILTEINKKLLEVELAKTSCHCSTCKYNFPHPKVLCWEADHVPRKTTSCHLNSANTRRNMINSKQTSSYSQIEKSCTSGIEFPQANLLGSNKSEKLTQLEQDLVLVRGLLNGLTNDKNMIVNVINELQSSYKNLQKRNEQQEKEIEILKEENRKLIGHTERQASDDNLHLVNVKHSLQMCENKLNKLDYTMIRLLKSYQQSKENELKYEQENQNLLKTNEELRGILKETLDDLQTFQNDAINVKKLFQELNETCEIYKRELKEKSEGTAKLASLINKLGPRVFTIDEMKKRYQKVLEKEDTNILKELESELKLKTVVSSKKSVKSSDLVNPEVTLRLTKSRCSIETSGTFEEFIHVLYEEIHHTLSKEKEAEEGRDEVYETDCVLCLTQNEGEIAKPIENRVSFVEKELQFTTYSYCDDDEEYELECICETCEES